MSYLTEFAFAVPALATAAAVLAVVLDDRRWMIAMLAVIYLSGAWFAALAMPPRLAAVRLAVGFLVCVMLLLSARGAAANGALHAGALPHGRGFRLVASLLVVVTVFGMSATGWKIDERLRASVALEATAVLALGLLQMGTSADPLRVGIGLLTCLAGFESAFSALEPSLAIMVMLAGVNLALAFVISFLVQGISGGEMRRAKP